MNRKLFLLTALAALMLFTEFNCYAQVSGRGNWDTISIPIPKPKPDPSQQKNIVKENIDKKRKPELYADFKRDMGWFVGVDTIDQKTASHRQINYRLSEMNAAGHWTKIEIVDSNENIKDNEGLRLLQPYQDYFMKWTKYPWVLRNISSIDLEYDSKGELVIRETAKDMNGNVVYTGGYKYSVDPSSGKTEVTVSYLQQDNAALFELNLTRTSNICYTYINDSFKELVLIDLDGKLLERARVLEYDSILYLDKYHRIDSVLYLKHEKKHETSDSIHKKEYRYDDKGNTIYEKWTNIAGDVRYFYEKKTEYIKEQSLEGIISVDSLDSHGNITWSYQLRDGKLLTMEDGYNMRHSIYDYYDTKHPESYKVTTKYYLKKDSMFCLAHNWDSGGIIDTFNMTCNKTLLQVDETYNQKDSTYSIKIFDCQGLYAGGGQIHASSSYKPFFRHPMGYFRYLVALSANDSYVDIGPDDTPLFLKNHSTPNAMIVSITGERARRLGLQDNDIIAEWDEWKYLNYMDTTPDLNQLWIYTILTQSRNKDIIILRHLNDTIQTFLLNLPKGNLDELQFTLLPTNVSYSTKRILSNHTHSILKLWRRIPNSVWANLMIGIPQDPYIHKPIIIYAAGHHQSQYYTPDIRPDTQHEWRFYREDNGYTNNFSMPENGEKISAWFSNDFNNIQFAQGIENDFNLVSVKMKIDSGLFASFNYQEKVYLDLNRIEIELPLILEKKIQDKNNANISRNSTIYAYSPYDIMKYSLAKWDSWKNSDNLPLTEKLLYHKRISYKHDDWEEWDKKFIKGAKKSYIISLDYTDEEQTLRFVDAMKRFAMSKDYDNTYHIYETNARNDYYILINYDPSDSESKARAEKGKVGKGSKIFIYDRANRMAAYIER